MRPAKGRREVGVSAVVLLWVDLRRLHLVPGLFEDLCGAYPAVRISDAAAIGEAIGKLSPRVLCFEFDQPESGGLTALQNTLTHFPALPLLMLTGHHSERLAVWAFRSGVTDYLASPLAPDEFCAALDALLRNPEPASARCNRRLPIPREDCFCAAGQSRQRTAQAAAYIMAHIDKKIVLNTLATLCHMSGSEFSRQFKREHCITLREFILRTRMERAREILRSADTSISEVAYAVGFNDLSHFTRVFRRFAGVCPTGYLRSLSASA